MSAVTVTRSAAGRAVLAAERRRERAVERGDDPFRVHTVYDDADQAPILLADMLEHRVDQQSWRGARACAGMDPAIFFPERGDVETLALARSCCDACPVDGACLDAHLHEREGVFAGTTPKQRRTIRRQRARRSA